MLFVLVNDFHLFCDEYKYYSSKLSKKKACLSSWKKHTVTVRMQYNQIKILVFFTWLILLENKLIVQANT